MFGLRLTQPNNKTGTFQSVLPTRLLRHVGKGSVSVAPEQEVGSVLVVTEHVGEALADDGPDHDASSSCTGEVQPCKSALASLVVDFRRKELWNLMSIENEFYHYYYYDIIILTFCRYPGKPILSNGLVSDCDKN